MPTINLGVESQRKSISACLAFVSSRCSAMRRMAGAMLLCCLVCGALPSEGRVSSRAPARTRPSRHFLGWQRFRGGNAVINILREQAEQAMREQEQRDDMRSLICLARATVGLFLVFQPMNHMGLVEAPIGRTVAQLFFASHFYLRLGWLLTQGQDFFDVPRTQRGRLKKRGVSFVILVGCLMVSSTSPLHRPVSLCGPAQPPCLLAAHHIVHVVVRSASCVRARCGPRACSGRRPSTWAGRKRSCPCFAARCRVASRWASSWRAPSPTSSTTPRGARAPSLRSTSAHRRSDPIRSDQIDPAGCGAAGPMCPLTKLATTDPCPCCVPPVPPMRQ